MSQLGFKDEHAVKKVEMALDIMQQEPGLHHGHGVLSHKPSARPRIFCQKRRECVVPSVTSPPGTSLCSSLGSSNRMRSAMSIAPSVKHQERSTLSLISVWGCGAGPCQLVLHFSSSSPAIRSLLFMSVCLDLSLRMISVASQAYGSSSSMPHEEICSAFARLHLCRSSWWYGSPPYPTCC
ncbi:hypothetical protein CFC21_095212 [Triticum aestivum]|uniref:Uncharacterized protein n=2 Tax=Triticum aestivum TaxID=4565 RepID=A0A3B6R730_WHEAT|nr:uncharacterized protein LOC123147088 [Triticum aestivum]KAF7092755.1 hypothetical protein CFC21_095212 [Triticum aestivum]